MNFANYHVTWTYNNGQTTCHIADSSGEISSGITTCAKCDNFEKRVGRKISFARALTTFDKQMRSEIYEHLKITGQMKILTKSWTT